MTIDDVDCPFCWGTGVITVMETNQGTGETAERKRPCPEGCLTPDEAHDLAFKQAQAGDHPDGF